MAGIAIMIITPGLEAQLRQLVAERPTAYLRELAQGMGNIVYPSTIRKWCIKLGLAYRKENGPRSRMPPEIKERLLALASKQPPPYFSELAKATGDIVRPETIKIWCKKLGVPYRRDYGMPARIPPGTEVRLRALLAERPSPYYRELIQGIGKKVDRRTINKWCANMGLPYKPITGSRSKRTPEMEKRLRTLLAEQPFISRKELASAIGNIVSSATIINWCKELGLAYRLASRRESRRLRPEIENRLRLLVAEKTRASYSELARDLQVSPRSVRRWVMRLGLPHHDNRR